MNWQRVYDALVVRAVYIIGVVDTGLALGLAFGLGWTAEQVSAVIAFASASLALVLGRPVQRTPRV